MTIEHNKSVAADRYEPGRGSVRTWALGIVHNRAIDALRRNDVRNRRRAGDEGITERLAAAERTEVEVAQREAAESVRGLIDELPEEQSKVIELAYFGGFTTREIAGMLDAPLGTIKGRMRLGLEKLRAKLDGVEPLGGAAMMGSPGEGGASAVLALGV